MLSLFSSGLSKEISVLTDIDRAVSSPVMLWGADGWETICFGYAVFVASCLIVDSSLPNLGRLKVWVHWFVP